MTKAHLQGFVFVLKKENMKCKFQQILTLSVGKPIYAVPPQPLSLFLTSRAVVITSLR